jgi:HAD superfamily hydrolase (TIGR01490 family)
MIKYAFSDVDGTLARGFYIKLLGEALHKEGRFSPKYYNSLEEIFNEYKEGRLEYIKAAPEVVKAFAQGIKGGKRKETEKIGENCIKTHPEQIFPFTEGLISVLRYKGYAPVLLSGSPEEIILPFSRKFAINPEDTYATVFEAENGIYTGEVLRSMVEPGAKRNIVEKCANDIGVLLQDCAGFGDTENDLEFLELVGHPMAIKPNEKLRQHGAEKNWLICSHDDYIISAVRDHF